MRRPIVAMVVLLSMTAGPVPAHAQQQPEREEVGPTEDLMREHGLLSRILLIYDDTIARLRSGRAVPAGGVHRAAQLVRVFIEDYHERQEERYVFPEFERRKVLVDLVATLRQQHDAGRCLTDRILGATKPGAPGAAALTEPLEKFIRMYRPHKAREDTVLFVRLRDIVPKGAFETMGDLFEKRETELFGGNGFEKNVAEVTDLERLFGIADLPAVTPE